MFLTINDRFKICAIFVALSMHRLCAAEVFTAVSDLEELLNIETILISEMEAFVSAQEHNLNDLKRRLSEFQGENDEVSQSIIKHDEANPISDYLIIKRLVSDWEFIEQLVSHDQSHEFLRNIAMHRNVMTFPNDEDLNGAAIALTRLQDTYNLDTASIARGEIKGIKCSSQMSSNDCFEIGHQTCLNEEYHHASLWLNEAISRLNENDEESDGNSKADIMELLAFCEFHRGNIRTALNLSIELLELAPNHERAPENKVFFEKQLAGELEEKVDQMICRDDGSDDFDTANDDEFEVSNGDETYEKLCRGDIDPEPHLSAKLKCRYVTENSPFLKIAPLKLEEASRNPYIVVYHDVIYDNEIELIKQISKPRLQRARVVGESFKGAIANFRISKLAWLTDGDHDCVRNIGLRVEDMTGLSVNSAETLQVVNYGIGGYYKPHVDFFGNPPNMNVGDRIATVLFYMSDVLEGGATVFPNINVAVWPKKGSAAFWYNLHASGEGDYLTKHAACPVLIGSKWVTNKWLHERGQEFLRPCELEPDHPFLDL